MLDTSMPRFGRPPLVAAVAALFVVAHPATGLAQGAGPQSAAPPSNGPKGPGKSLADALPPSARTVYEAGRILFQDGDFATALLKFEDTYARANDPRLLWNIAACQKNLRHYAKAIEVIRRYLAESGARLSTQDRVEAQDLSAAIEPFTTTLALRVSEDAADVWLDEELLGRSPLAAPVQVDIGTRRVRAKKAGFRAFDKDIPVGGAKEVTVEVKLEREGGHLDLRVAPDATVLVDDHEVGHGPAIALDLSVGGHALWVTAPKMRPYQGEVAVEDGQTRALEIKLEAEAAAAAELRVSVACREPEVHTPEQGLTVFLDDSAVSASPLGVRKRMDQGREVVAYVPYTVSPGPHTVRVRYAGCLSLSTTANATAEAPAVVQGMLPPETPWLNGSPSGSPNGWVVSAGVSGNTLHFNSFSAALGGGANRQPIAATSDVGVAAAGPSASAGLQLRWFTLLVDARWITGNTTGSAPVVTYGGARPLLSTTSGAASLQEADFGLRVGPRFPFYFAALSFGVGGSLGALTIAPSGGGGGLTRGIAQATLWGAVDIQPLCNWGVRAGGGVAAVGTLGSSSSSSSGSCGGPTVCGPSGDSQDPQTTYATSFFVQLAYEPNRLCERQRAGLYRLEGTR
jgi:hypothetical protein